MHLLNYYGFKTNRPLVADPKVREAMSIAIKRADIVKSAVQGHADPAYTFVDPEAIDYNAGMVHIKEDVERAKKLLDEAGWKMGPDGFRHKDGVKLAPKVYFTAASYGPRVAEALQGYMRQIGVDWHIQGFDSTIAPVKMAELDYEIWTVTYSYLSAGDLLNFYFDSSNIPVPNRMFWNDPQTDEWLKAGRSALTDRDRAKYYGLAQKHISENHLWLPVMNVGLHMTTNKRLKGARPHMIHQSVMYKTLDYSY
jgi:peptide/nickel transport system substrate-binding protein